MYSRRLSILVVASDVPENIKPAKIGMVESFLDDSEFVDYIELLTASNFSFDIITPDKVSRETFFFDNLLKYSTVIFTTPLTLLPDAALLALKEASYELGISLISSYKHADQRSQSFFGIRGFRGKRNLWPLRVKIIKWPGDICKEEIIASYGLISGLPGIRKRGLKKLDLKRILVKLTKLFYNFFLAYIKVDLEQGVRVLSTDMKDNPVAWSYQYGNGTNYYFALRGDLFLDKFNEMHRLVRSAIEANSGHGMVSVDLENTMVLRLDDPGACLSDYLKNGNILEEKDWEEIGKILQVNKIPLNVMYTTGWVDDGDSESGTLFVGNEKISDRKGGTIYDSSRVKYFPAMRKGHICDHISEFKGLKNLSEEGLAEVHSHGNTHLDQDLKSWSMAKSKNKDTRWYHEFYSVKKRKKANKEAQLEAMKISRGKIMNFFDNIPCAFTPSGHRQSQDSDSLAYACGYLLFSSDFTGIFKENMAIRNWKIPSLFLYLKDTSNFALKSGYPFIGVVHDYEIKQYGLDFLIDIIKGWRIKGIKRFVSFKELAANLCFSVVGYWLEREKRFQIVISLPKGEGIKDIFSKSQKLEIRLRVVAPDKTNAYMDNLSIVGNNLVVRQQKVNLPASGGISSQDGAIVKNSIHMLCLDISMP